MWLRENGMLESARETANLVHYSELNPPIIVRVQRLQHLQLHD